MNRKNIAVVFMLCTVAESCGIQRRLRFLERTHPTASLSLPSEDGDFEIQFRDYSPNSSDTLKITDLDGREVMLMRAVKDDDGQMVATEELKAAVVTARFRNIAERHGKVDLEFDITVPAEMQGQEWQIRFLPKLFVMGDTLSLDRLLVTGDKYLRSQKKGYEQYERFVSRIISDTTVFVDYRNLEIFLRRNLPMIYAFRTDSTIVSDEEFSSCFGVTEREALDHYTDRLRLRLNERRKTLRTKMFSRYVRSPYLTEGIRFDTIVSADRKEFTYRYVQTMETRAGLRKMQLAVGGEIYEQNRLLYRIPDCDQLTFYVSSINTLAEDKTIYLTRVLERRVEAGSSCYIEFPSGKAEIDLTLGFNVSETDRIKENIRELVKNDKFDLDSIRISAWASPEGDMRANESLSEKRAAAAASFFSDFTRLYCDSLRREEGVLMDLSGEIQESSYSGELRFFSRSRGENWPMLDRLVEEDSLMTSAQKRIYARLAGMEDKDERENAMRKEQWYPHLRTWLYPRLRVVNVDFFLHRKGMVKDTVRTMEVDSVYAKGLKAIRECDYKRACSLIGGYDDYNAAVAHALCDHNRTALEILSRVPVNARVNYLLAIIYSRLGEKKKALERYLHACSLDPSYIHRGNLDPEIRALKKRYSPVGRNEDF